MAVRAAAALLHLCHSRFVVLIISVRHGMRMHTERWNMGNYLGKNFNIRANKTAPFTIE